MTPDVPMRDYLLARIASGRENATVLADTWPTYKIRIDTPRLTLRIPNDSELGRLAELAAHGVHCAQERPFLLPWAEGSAEDRARFVVSEHWSRLAKWSSASWSLGLAVFPSGSDQPVGSVTLRSRDFAITREVTTGSWLGLPHQRQGFGTEARMGILTLAFDHLGATDATTEVFQDNYSSQGVSRKLGYQPDGMSRDARDGKVVVSDRLRLTVDRWAAGERPRITVAGIDDARIMFL